MKKIALAVLFAIILAGCYLSVSRFSMARIPPQVADFVKAHDLKVEFSDSCLDESHLTEHGFLICSSQTMGGIEWAYVHEVGHYVYELDYCPKQIGGPCKMNRFDLITIVREEAFAQDFADSNGELWLIKTPKNYTKNLIAISPLDYNSQIMLYYGYGIGNKPIDPLEPVRLR